MGFRGTAQHSETTRPQPTSEKKKATLYTPATASSLYALVTNAVRITSLCSTRAELRITDLKPKTHIYFCNSPSNLSVSSACVLRSLLFSVLQKNSASRMQPANARESGPPSRDTDAARVFAHAHNCTRAASTRRKDQEFSLSAALL